MSIDYLKTERKLCKTSLANLKLRLDKATTKRERLLIESDIEVCKQQLADINFDIAIENIRRRT